MPILQSDIGSREFATGFLSEILGSGFQEGVLATAVDRVLEMALALAGTIVFLLSDLSTHLTGQNIVVDDGFSL